MKNDHPKLPRPGQATLLDAFEIAAAQAPTHGITIYDRRGQNAEKRTYPQVLEMAQRGAARLAAAGINVGERVLVCLPTSWSLIEIYFGAIFRGAQPVMVAPPGALGGAAAHAHKIEGLVSLLSPKRLICDGAAMKEFQEFGAPEAAKIALTPEQLEALTPAAGITEHRPNPSDLAFLQLTSGSTGRQRAVMITHANVIHNTIAIGKMSGATPFAELDRVVSWLPLNHDMGLVGCLLYSVVHGLDIFLLRPESFLARPRLWLQTFSANKGTQSAGPNFAFQLCVERIEAEEVAGIDLSSWRIAITGAEMVHPDTCAQFSQKFASCGFNPKTLVPSYGMAEATLAVTSDLKQRGVRMAPVPIGNEGGLGLKEVVCVGEPVMETQVRISSASSHGTFLDDGKVGEVCVSGPGIFGGYYNDAASTADALQPAADAMWLRTGDIGFMKDGELYITGRTKDLLIIHGHNLMPHELEWLAEGVSGGGGAERCGAFSVETSAQGEQAVLVMEANVSDPAELTKIEHEVRTRLGRALGLPLSDLVFVKRGQIPKTTSGKVQRRELRQRYLDGKLERLK